MLFRTGTAVVHGLRVPIYIRSGDRPEPKKGAGAIGGWGMLVRMYTYPLAGCLIYFCVELE